MTVTFKSGDFRRRIVLQQRSVTQDSFGGQSEAWSDIVTVWADILPLSGRELLAAQAVQAEVSHTITTRYRSNFDDPKASAAMRATYKGRIFNIGAAINVDERNRIITLSAMEGLNNG